MSQGYAVTNAISGLAATAFTWSSAFTTNRDRLNDGKQDWLVAGSSTAQASGQTLTVDLGSATGIVGIALLNHNLATGSCTVAVSSDDNSGFASPTTRKSASTINTASPYQYDTILQFPSASERYWRLTFAHSGTKIVTLGELLLFTAITTLTRQEVYGRGEENRYPQNRVESPTGFQRATALSGPIRTKRLPFRDLRGTTERDELRTMWEATSGGARNLLYIDEIDSSSSAGDAESQQCLWGKLAESWGWSEDDFSIYQPTELVLTGQGREVSA
jgi:hypothetical protein